MFIIRFHIIIVIIIIFVTTKCTYYLKYTFCNQQTLLETNEDNKAQVLCARSLLPNRSIKRAA